MIKIFILPPISTLFAIVSTVWIMSSSLLTNNFYLHLNTDYTSSGPAENLTQEISLQVFMPCHSSPGYSQFSFTVI